MLVKLNQATTQNGFTLVEVLTVMLVLVAIASVTIEVSSDLAFQNRYEVTKDRYEKIKRAIIGRPDVLINGQPDISGFVADMGRLPRNLQELLVQNYCSDDYRISDNTPDNSGIAGATGTTPREWCTSATGTPDGWHSASCTAPTGYTQALCTDAGGVWNDWNGPYLATQKPDYEPDAVSDGWANSATALTDHNYGWEFCLGDNPDLNDKNNTCLEFSGTAGNNAISIKSKGKNSVLNNSDTGYDKDYPESVTSSNPAIKFNDWTVNVSTGIVAKIHTPVSFTPCDITTLSNQQSCEIAGQYWVTSQRCEDSTITQASCTPIPLIWDNINSVCVDTSKDNSTCTGTWVTKAPFCESFINSTCDGSGFNWNTSTGKCESTSKAFCDTYVTLSAPSSATLTLDLYNENCSSAITTTSGNTQILEDEHAHDVLFTGIAPSNIPQGKYCLKINKAGAIYPTGHQSILIYLIPNSSIPVINW